MFAESGSRIGVSMVPGLRMLGYHSKVPKYSPGLRNHGQFRGFQAASTPAISARLVIPYCCRMLAAMDER
jgi:hypothetical protein